MNNENAPLDLALTWLVETDEEYLCPNQDQRLKQRFAAAALLYAKYGTISSNFAGLHECQWPQLFCTESDNIIYRVTIKEYGFPSTLPNQLSLLPGLDILEISNSNITGTIPESILELSNLRLIDFDKNSITGVYPHSAALKPNLIKLDINFNEISGSIDFLTQYPNVKYVYLDNNKFNGAIPEALGDLTSLEHLTLHGNNFTGVMPQSICNLRATGNLNTLMADCDGQEPKVQCSCCTHCTPY